MICTSMCVIVWTGGCKFRGPDRDLGILFAARSCLRILSPSPLSQTYTKPTRPPNHTASSPSKPDFHPPIIPHRHPRPPNRAPLNHQHHNRPRQQKRRGAPIVTVNTAMALIPPLSIAATVSLLLALKTRPAGYQTETRNGLARWPAGQIR